VFVMLAGLGSSAVLAQDLYRRAAADNPDNMVAWLRNPQRIVPGNAMPDIGMSEADARAVAAYLGTLR
jgi:cytochrome c2